MRRTQRQELALMRVALAERIEQLQQHIDIIRDDIKEIKSSIRMIRRSGTDRRRP